MENNEKKSFSFSLTEKIINSSFAIVSLLFLAVIKILFCFGVYSSVLSGIFSLIIVSLAVVGVLWNYLKNNKPTLEFFFSAGVCVLVFFCLV